MTNSRPLDTSTLPPIRVEPNAEREQRNAAWEALRSIAVSDITSARESAAIWDFLDVIRDSTLARLGRLLK